jgi:CDP-paratose 2-epimerase
MNLLITGGCGFLGSNLALEGIRRGYQVSLLDNLSRTGSEENLKWLRSQGKVTFYKVDIADQPSVDRVVRELQPDMIFHVAGQVAMTTSIKDPRLDFTTNVLGTFNLLEAVHRHCPTSGFIYASTNKVYGDFKSVTFVEGETRYTCPEHPNGFNEDLPLNFHSPYGCSKGAADQYVLDYARIFALNTAVFRHSTIYGERQFATFDQGWIGWFCQQALETAETPHRPPFTVSGNGKQVRDLLFMNDAVDCYFKAAASIHKIKGEVFNIGGGVKNSLSLLELFSLLESLTGTSLQFKHLDWRESDQVLFVADHTKATELLGWNPQYSASEGVKLMLHWLSEYRKEPHNKKMEATI